MLTFILKKHTQKIYNFKLAARGMHFLIFKVPIIFKKENFAMHELPGLLAYLRRFFLAAGGSYKVF